MLLGLLLLWRRHIAVGRVASDRLGHPADEVVGAQQVEQRVVERLRKRRERSMFLDHAPVTSFAERIEEFDKGHGVQVDEVYLSDRE